VLLPLAGQDVFVRTYERGAGLTASCGSGMAASRAVYSRLRRAEPEEEVIVRNAGGLAVISLRVRDGRWFPVLQGNATFVYRADVDPAALARAMPAAADRTPYDDEVRAYDALDRANAETLNAAAIETKSFLSRTSRGSPPRNPLNAAAAP
jgi:diaminopimelate epimerase